MNTLNNQKKITNKIILCLLIVITCLAKTSQAQTKTRVFIVTTLYKKHESTLVYNLDTLKKIIDRIRPDIAVLDVTPTELKERKVHPGKIEYPGVIFPWLDKWNIPAYGSEPAEPMFTELVDIVKNAYQKLESLNPAASNLLKTYRQVTSEVLKQAWQSPAIVNGNRTDVIFNALASVEAAFAGDDVMCVTNQWNEHHARVILEVARSNKGKKVLAFLGTQNVYAVKKLLAQSSDIDLVAMEEWLK